MTARVASLRGSDVRCGSKPVLGAPSRHVRLAAVSGLHLGVAIGRRCAKSGQILFMDRYRFM
jgi:hypothetical protein